ncbi:hypothetical protein B0T24DRAFT_600601 [Lasiosphaeria ovina]|uniref:Uncharacterized protein n=1 Tax=Lasiosphaeria ovina TaxID=92902 RepID=A0AAE0NIQ0_9PEZI|nr:hypothetical protein B0T24DRAFT_600601 [Lasiosphaeria ovina]
MWLPPFLPQWLHLGRLESSSGSRRRVSSSRPPVSSCISLATHSAIFQPVLPLPWSSGPVPNTVGMSTYTCTGGREGPGAMHSSHRKHTTFRSRCHYRASSTYRFLCVCGSYRPIPWSWSRRLASRNPMLPPRVAGIPLGRPVVLSLDSGERAPATCCTPVIVVSPG